MRSGVKDDGPQPSPFNILSLTDKRQCAASAVRRSAHCPDRLSNSSDNIKMPWEGNIARSPLYKPPPVPQGVTLIEYLLTKNDRLSQFGDQPYLTVVGTEEDSTLTYSLVEPRVRRCASALRRRGLRRGDVVCFYAPNHLEYIMCNLGVVACGASALLVPFYAGGSDPSPTKHLETFCMREKPRFLFTTAAFFNEDVRATVKKCPSIEQVFTFDPCNDDGATPVADFDKDDGTEFPNQAELSPSDVATIFLSSGTTGEPKAIDHTHASLLAALQGNIEQTLVAVTPYHLAHLSGFLAHLILLRQGGHCIMAPSGDVSALLFSIRLQAAAMWCTPRELVRLARDSELTRNYQLGSLIALACGGSHLGDVLLDQIREKLPHIKLHFQMYASTESIMISATPLGRERKRGSVGELTPAVEAKVVKPGTWECVGPGERGELCVRVPYLMKGYRGKPELTEASVQEGFYRTGDYGWVDEDGWVFLVDRVKDLIPVLGSDQTTVIYVSPSEIEDCLYEHQGVLKVGVAGVPHPEPDHHQIPKAFVVPVFPGCLTEQDLKDFVSSRLSAECQLEGGVTFVDDIPMSMAGKIQRNVLQSL
ncbi:unnamed protein product [Darwinula stevensoni]|uniref:Uncharacterized protein n=1 Tax=Darwinula stevensoni TaxID=69355 RepID=A0A7R8XBG1_9CRUS|nr:unnamed protein product [Darwinula stevensoni]CAG0887742.1 unnamed protein product [Darwinula stevensoni]